MLLIYLSCAWIAGILLGSKLSIHPLWLIASLLPLPFIFFFRRRKRLLITIALLILAVLGGIVRYQSSLPTAEGENYVQCYNDKTAIELKGVISQAPDVRDKSTHLYLSRITMNRYEDFKRIYKDEKRKNKDVDYLSYNMSDYMIGLTITKGFEKTVVVNGKAALPKFQQQMKILKSAERKFESSLFEIKQLLQADLFDSELDTAHELIKNGYIRAAGAIAGVVLEKHLEQIALIHKIPIKAKNPSISDYNDTLKEREVIDVPTWRFIQHLSELRNLCDHKKKREPTPEEITDLINGVDKIAKTIF